MMRSKGILAAVLSIGLLFSVGQAAEKQKLSDQKDKDSYSLGWQYGDAIKKQGVEINLDLYTAGMRDALTGKEALMSQEEVKAAISDLQLRVTTARQKEMREKAVKNLAEGKAFLEENKKKEGVKVLASGLQYKVLVQGTGKTPGAEDTVTVHYRGTLLDNREFDSSLKRGKPATFKVNGVIKGWTEALQLMKEGAKWQLFIPPELAYGERGNPRIDPNSVLVFDVELISVSPGEKK